MRKVKAGFLSCSHDQIYKLLRENQYTGQQERRSAALVKERIRNILIQHSRRHHVAPLPPRLRVEVPEDILEKIRYLTAKTSS